MRAYISRFTKILNEAINVSADRAIDAFSEGIRRETHIEELGRRKPQTITELMEIANGWADGEELARRSRPRDDDDDSRREKDSNKRRDYGKDRRDKRRDDRRDDVRHVAAGYVDRRDDRGDARRDDRRDDQRRDDRRGDTSNNQREPTNWVPRVAHLPPAEQINAPCYLHTFINPVDNQRKSSYLLRECRQLLDMQKYHDILQGRSNTQHHYPTLPPPPPHPVPQMQQHMQPQLPPPPMQPPQVQQQPQTQQQLQIHQNAPEAFPNPRGSIGQMHMVQVRQGEAGKTSAPPIHRIQMYMLQARNVMAPNISATPKPSAEVNMIQKGGLTKREMKKLTREVNLAEATMGITPEYLNWSEQNITYS